MSGINDVRAASAAAKKSVTALKFPSEVPAFPAISGPDCLEDSIEFLSEYRNDLDMDHLRAAMAVAIDELSAVRAKP
jgi:hypothetical protein